jgi:hypothetical protein
VDLTRRATDARTIAWEARDEASRAASAGDLTGAQVWHDLADAADDLAVMVTRMPQHLTDHG